MRQEKPGPGGRGRGCGSNLRKAGLLAWMLLVLLVSLGQRAGAAEPYQPTVVNPLTEAWRWRHFPELDGTGIRCIAETADRRVYVGSSDGVVAYDGYDWTPLRGPGSPAGSPVEQLLVDRNGGVYATNEAGIYHYDGRDWTTIFSAPANRPFSFSALKQLSDGSLVACSQRGFLLLDEGQPVLYTSPDRWAAFGSELPDVTYVGLPADALSEGGGFHSTSDLLEDSRGNVWFAITTEMESGSLLRIPRERLGRPSLGNYEVIRSNGTISLGADQRLLEAADGRIWVINSSSDRGTLIYDRGRWETLYINRLFGGDEYMTGIVQSDNGIIWVSTIAKLFSYAPDGTWAMYKSPGFPIPANRVLLQQSQSDQLWLAGYKSKLLLLDFSLSRWLTYAGLSYQLSDGGAEDWFLENDGRAVHRRGNDWTAYGTADGLMDAPVRLLRTSRGQLWAAGSHEGRAATALYRDGRWERHLHPTLSWGIDYRAVFEASDGTLWFGGSVDARSQDGFTSGLLELPDPTADELRWVRHTYGEDGLNQGNVYGIGETPDGRIWIGGSNLLFYDGDSWKAVEDERLQQYVNCLYSTDEKLLVGSRYFGVFVYDGREWRNYTSSDGLPGNTIISIDALTDSTFIVATENGTAVFDGSSWTRDLFPDELNLDFEGGTVTHNDSYVWIDHVPRSWKRRALHGSAADLDRDAFYSTRYQPSETPPETSIAFYTERIPSDGNGIISWKGKDYFGKTRADHLVYSYRLDGGGWLPYSPVAEYAFTGLGDGPHRLEVRARDLDFNVDPTPATVSFKVLPPIWKQGWFIGLILLFLMIFGFYEYRVHAKNAKLETVNISLQDRNVEVREQRDKLEGMLIQLENLSKAKVGFFTNISHELRTPLTLILGPIDQLVEDRERLPASRRQQLQAIVQRNARRLLRLIDQLLEIRRIEQSALEIKLSDVRMSVYLAGITELFEDLSVERDILLQFHDESGDATVSIDADKVEKILANLLSNAFRHTPPGGTISVGLATVVAEPNALSPYYDRYFEISVEDTGSGISPEKIDLIFDKYYTAPSAASTETGSGIGLSYIKDLVYLMQGDIRVSSTPGSGSSFRVYLPYIVSYVAAPPPVSTDSLQISRREAAVLMNTYQQSSVTSPEPPVADLSRQRILVVEDNPDMLEFLAQLLQNTYSVVTADNGRDGLRLARQQSFDMVLSDIMMGEMDGITLCDRLKSHLETSHIPVILLTAKVLDETRASGYVHGADDYITKPFNPDLLLVRVRNLLAQRERLREKFNLDFQLTPETEEFTSPDEEFLNRLATLLQENVSESDFNVKAMCEAMHLSHMHFIRKVKQLTGKKPIDLLKSYRMKMARDLLSQDSLTIAEVAYRVGFDLPNSFSRTFKKEFDMTPTQFVRSIRQQEDQL